MTLTPIAFYLFVCPLAAALLATLYRSLTAWRSGKIEGEDACLLWFLNYSLANLYFVWCWNSIQTEQWRTGLLTISTGVVVLLTVGQTAASIRTLGRRGTIHGPAVFCLACAACLNVPVTVVTIWRKVHNLSIG